MYLRVWKSHLKSIWGYCLYLGDRRGILQISTIDQVFQLFSVYINRGRGDLNNVVPRVKILNVKVLTKCCFESQLEVPQLVVYIHTLHLNPQFLIEENEAFNGIQENPETIIINRQISVRGVMWQYS